MKRWVALLSAERSTGAAPSRQTSPGVVPMCSTRGRSRPADERVPRGTGLGAWTGPGRNQAADEIRHPRCVRLTQCRRRWHLQWRTRSKPQQRTEVSKFSLFRQEEKPGGAGRSAAVSQHYCCSSLPLLHSPALQHKTGLNRFPASHLKATAGKTREGQSRAEPCQPWEARNRNAWETNRYTLLHGTEAGWARSCLVGKSRK